MDTVQIVHPSGLGEAEDTTSAEPGFCYQHCNSGVRAPRWLVALSGDLLSDQVMRPQGLRNVSRGLFEQFESVDSAAYEDQVFSKCFLL